MQNQQAAMDHLKNHQTYPATKADLVAACNNLSDFSAEDKQWFMNTLPENTYNSAEDVMKALGWTGGMTGETPPPAGGDDNSQPPAGGGIPPADNTGGQTPPQA